MFWHYCYFQFVFKLFIQVSCYGGCSGLVVVVEYRTCNRQVAGSTHTRSTASNIEQVANLLCAQANSASYPQRDGKCRPSPHSYGYGVKA